MAAHHRVGLAQVGEAPHQLLLQGGERIARLREPLVEAGCQRRPDRGKRHVLVDQLPGGQSQQIGRHTRAEARPDREQRSGDRAARVPRLWSGHQRAGLGDPDQVHPPVRQDAAILARVGAVDRVDPEALDERPQRRGGTDGGVALAGRGG